MDIEDGQESTETESTESAESTEGTESTEENKPENDLPEWARKELSKARSDAARYRTSLRDAEAKLADAKSPEDIEAAVREVREANEKLTREIAVRDIAAKHGLPPALAARVAGSTPEEMEADAKELAKLIAPAPTGTPGGGLNPNEDADDEKDPRKLAARYRRR